jgi:hypothetical protein
MATCRVAINEAMRALRATAPGDDPTADELVVGIEAISNLVLDIHEARGPMRDIDIPSRDTERAGFPPCRPGSAPPAGQPKPLTYVPGENERLRIQPNFDVAITLPNSVRHTGWIDPYDYGFLPGRFRPSLGSTGPADGIEWRAPEDGARIEIVGTSQALYFYRADLNQWMPATGFATDTELPFNNRLTSAFEALLAERLMDVVSAAAPTPNLLKRIARGRSAIFLQTGRRRSSRVGEYF